MEPLLVRFAREFGWRAYAIPVLAVVTIWIVVDMIGGAGAQDAPTTVAAPTSHSSAVTPAAGDEGASARPTAPWGKGPDPAAAPIPFIPENELPPGAPFTEHGAGTFHTVGVGGPVVGQGEKVFTYVIEVEDGLNPAVYGGDDAVAAMVDATLADPRGWSADPRFAFQHLDPADPRTPDLRIQLTSVGTTHDLCGHSLEVETSCFYSDGRRVLLNESRWIRGAQPFNGDLGAYRQYLINHEVGHGIGFAQHEPCGRDGALAPVMMQQTLSLSNSVLAAMNPTEVYSDDGAVCRYNPWPYPHV